MPKIIYKRLYFCSKTMRCFSKPQDPFLEREFVDVLSNHIKVNKKNVPTIRNKTYFWSTEFYRGIKTQYLIRKNIKNPDKYFYMKRPLPYEKAFNESHKYFRNRVRKAKKNGLYFEDLAKSHENINECYNIYSDNMKRIKSFSFDFSFFKSLCELSYSQIFAIKNKGMIVSFSLMLGNFMFIQSSSYTGKKLCATNLLYDQIFYHFQKNKIFFGTAEENNSGLNRFKRNAGLQAIPVKKIGVFLKLKLPSLLIKNKAIGLLMRNINKKLILRYALPY